jgi:cysteine-rich repeat protein
MRARAIAAFWGLTMLVVSAAAQAADPLVVISISASGTTTVCDTNCTTCTVGSGECVLVGEEDLLLCTPTSSGIPITACDWSHFLDGDAPDLQINTQMRALADAPNGNFAFVALNDTTVPGVGALLKQDVAVLNPDDIFRPFVGGGPYDDGSFKLYLNGDLTQQEEVTAKPWDALALLTGDGCEAAISATASLPHSCPIIGSLTGGSGGPGLDGVHFENEDLLRCIPDAFALNGTVEACAFAMFLEADRINGPGNGISTDIEAIDFLSFDGTTMSGQMVFKSGGGTPPGFPTYTAGKDLLLYDGTFGAGNCVPSGNPCADSSDCPSGESCDTGSCVIGGAPCATDQDCSGAGNTCATVRSPSATVTMYFDGVAVGLTGTGQNIEAFALLSEDDGDGVPDGFDNCPAIPNPPNQCSGPGPETCPSGLSSECPGGELCEQADDDDDGVGDPCDQCQGRDDAVCFCGDNILDLPSEQCDLGSQNGVSGSPCSSDCTISGLCKGSGTPCETAADCPLGEGCCGNNLTEANEACDDGNVIEDDNCTTTCDVNLAGVPILGCEDLTGPNITPAFVKVTTFKDTPDFADFDRWKSKGDFNFAEGLPIDPDTQDVTIVYNNNLTGELFTSTLAAGSCTPSPCFVQGGSATKPKWLFLDPDAAVVGAPGWRKGKFSRNENKIKLGVDGRNTTLFSLLEADSPPTMRQTIRIDDVCATAVLLCEIKSNGKVLKCVSTP